LTAAASLNEQAPQVLFIINSEVRAGSGLYTHFLRVHIRIELGQGYYARRIIVPFDLNEQVTDARLPELGDAPCNGQYCCEPNMLRYTEIVIRAC
jgi:hypothetical protein